MAKFQYIRSSPIIMIMNKNHDEICELRSIIEKWNYKVSAFDNEAETLLIAQEIIPDLILLDVKRDDFESFETAKKLKNIEEIKHIPIIFCTSLENEQDVDKCFRAGADDYLSKPYDAVEIKIRLKAKLEKLKIYMELQEELKTKHLNETRLDYMLKFNQNLMDSIPTPIGFKDKNSDYITCNKAFEKFFNLNKDEIQFMSDFDLFSKNRATFIREKDLETLDKNIVEFERVEIDHNCEAHDMYFYNSTYSLDDGENGIINVMFDITERKKMERSVQQAKLRLQSTNIKQKKLISIISHDLRGPVGNLASGLKLFVEDFDGYSQEERNFFVTELYKSASNSYDLLENLLLWARSENDESYYSPNNYKIGAIIYEAIHPLQGLLNSKAISIDFVMNMDTIAFCDDNMLRTIVRNIVSNAIKFSPRKENIVIEVKDYASYVEVQIKDNGVGMSASVKEKVFKIDSRVSTKGTESESGSGFGLKLCKEFVTKNKGKIWVESELGNGSIFYFTLPKKS